MVEVGLRKTQLQRGAQKMVPIMKAARAPLVFFMLLHLPVLMLPTSAEMKPPEMPELLSSLRNKQKVGCTVQTPQTVPFQVHDSSPCIISFGSTSYDSAVF